MARNTVTFENGDDEMPYELSVTAGHASWVSIEIESDHDHLRDNEETAVHIGLPPLVARQLGKTLIAFAKEAERFDQ